MVEDAKAAIVTNLRSEFSEINFKRLFPGNCRYKTAERRVGKPAGIWRDANRFECCAQKTSTWSGVRFKKSARLLMRSMRWLAELKALAATRGCTPDDLVND
jgi:hypothetical protein